MDGGKWKIDLFLFGTVEEALKDIQFEIKNFIEM